MGTNFLETIALTPEERAKLLELGAESPLALLTMRQASPDAFDKHLSSARADDVCSMLKGLLSPSEHDLLERPSKPGGALGARLTRART